MGEGVSADISERSLGGSDEFDQTVIVPPMETKYCEPLALKLVAGLLRILFFLLGCCCFGAAVLYVGVMIYATTLAPLHWSEFEKPTFVASIVSAIIVCLIGKWCFRLSQFFKPLER